MRTPASRMPAEWRERRFASKGPPATFSVGIMRRWVIAAGLAFAPLGPALALAGTNLGRFLDAQRERLVTAVRSEIGRHIELGDIGVSLRGGLGVRVADVRVPDDPGWSDGDILRAAEVRVAVRL